MGFRFASRFWFLWMVPVYLIDPVFVSPVTAEPLMPEKWYEIEIKKPVRFPYENVKKIVVEDEGKLDVKVDYSRKEITATGIEAGETGLILIGQDEKRKVYGIRVLPGKRGKSELSRLREAVRSLPDLKASKDGDKMVVRGLVASDQEAKRLETLLNSFPGALNQTHISPEGDNRRIESEIKTRAGISPLQVRVDKDKVFLEGEFYSEQNRDRVRKLAETYGKPVVDLTKINRPLIEMDVRIVQVETGKGESFGGNLLKNLGITGQGDWSGSLNPRVLLTATAVSSLNLLVNRGRAAVLSEPHLTTRSGESAVFHSGGEVGFRITGVNSSDVKFKQYGLVFEIKPLLTDQGLIESHVKIEISAPASSPVSSTDVGFTRFNAESEITGRPDETIIIAGLAENIQHFFGEETPVLGKIPVFNLFFSQKQEQNSRRDLLMMVTPTIARVEKRGDYTSHALLQRNRMDRSHEEEEEPGEE